MEDARLGIVGIVIEDLEKVGQVNEILHQYADLIVGRMGVPYKTRGVSVIALIVDGSTDELSAMTGKLGKLSGITLKSGLIKK
jgi:putative iron-only hydrogenase system regulator